MKNFDQQYTHNNFTCFSSHRNIQKYTQKNNFFKCRHTHTERERDNRYNYDQLFILLWINQSLLLIQYNVSTFDITNIYTNAFHVHISHLNICFFWGIYRVIRYISFSQILANTWYSPAILLSSRFYVFISNMRKWKYDVILLYQNDFVSFGNFNTVYML